MRPLRARTTPSSWRGEGTPSPPNPRTAARGRLSGRSFPLSGRDRLLEVEHISVRVGKLTEPLAPFHFLGRHGEFDAQLPHPLVIRDDVVREERDPGRTRFRLVHLAHVNAGLRTKRTHLDPMTRIVRRSLDGRVDIRRSEEHTSELQSLAYLVCRLLLE